MLKMSLEPKVVRPRRVNSAKIANDNTVTAWSGLSFREQSIVKKRLIDLSWQKNFAEIQLNRTQSLSPQGQSAVQALYHRANSELKKLEAFR